MAVHTVTEAVLGQCDERSGAKKLDVRTQLLRRAERLPERDRVVLRAVLLGRNSFRELQGMLGISAGQLCRRFRAMTLRLRHPVSVALCDLASADVDLTDQQRQVAIKHFLLGRSARAIAKEMRLSHRDVIATVAYVRGWTKGVAREMRATLEAEALVTEKLQL